MVDFNPALPLELQMVLSDEMDGLIALLNARKADGIFGAIVFVISNEDGAIHWQQSATPGGRKNNVIGLLDAAQSMFRTDGEEDDE